MVLEAGGGAGGLIFIENQSVEEGSYKLKVGSGGLRVLFQPRI